MHLNEETESKVHEKALVPSHNPRSETPMNVMKPHGRHTSSMAATGWADKSRLTLLTNTTSRLDPQHLLGAHNP